jgi:hypothetical protein
MLSTSFFSATSYAALLGPFMAIACDFGSAAVVNMKHTGRQTRFPSMMFSSLTLLLIHWDGACSGT